MSEPIPFEKAIEDLKTVAEPLRKPCTGDEPPERATARSNLPAAIEKVRTEANKAIAGREGLIAKYQSHDEWSRHYSQARMTVVPFGITTAIAVLAWGWDRTEVFPLTDMIFDPGVALFPALALVVWIATMLLMFTLTFKTYSQGDSMLKAASEAGISKRDGKSLSRKFWSDLPLWGSIIASVGFLAAYVQHCATFDGKTAPADVRIVTPEPVDTGDTEEGN